MIIFVRLKQNLRENILRVDFSKNYSTKQFHEIQTAQFGQEAFNLYTAACYYKADIIIENSKDDKEPGLKVLSLVIVSNDTVNERNVAFTRNVKLVNIVRKYI